MHNSNSSVHLVLREHIWRGDPILESRLLVLSGDLRPLHRPIFPLLWPRWPPFHQRATLQWECGPPLSQYVRGWGDCASVKWVGLGCAIKVLCCVAVLWRCWTTLPSAPLHLAFLLCHTLFPRYGGLKHSGKIYSMEKSEYICCKWGITILSKMLHIRYLTLST